MPKTNQFFNIFSLKEARSPGLAAMSLEYVRPLAQIIYATKANEVLKKQNNNPADVNKKN